MAEINLRAFYPWHHQNQYIEISEELIELFRQWEREEHAYLQKRRRYRAVYSLDRGDGIEVKAAVSVISPDEECERKETCERLFQALFSLSPTQRRRIILHCILDMPQSQVARMEGVSPKAVNASILSGLKRLKLFLKDC